MARSTFKYTYTMSYENDFLVEWASHTYFNLADFTSATGSEVNELSGKNEKGRGMRVGETEWS